jgi:hypothetical protein
LSTDLLDFLRNVTHADKAQRIEIINTPTDTPIKTHSFRPKTDVFFDSSAFKLSDDISGPPEITIENGIMQSDFTPRD